MDKSPRDLLLEDTLRVAMEASKRVIQYRRAVIVLSIIVIGLIVGYFI